MAHVLLRRAGVIAAERWGRLLRHVAFWLAVATFISFAGSFWWILDLGSHFRMQYAWLLALCLIGFALCRQPRAALLVSIPLIVNLAVIYPLYRPIGATPTDSSRFTAIQFNVAADNPRLNEAIAWIRTRDPDVLVLHEVTAASLRRWIAGLPDHTVIADAARSDPFGMVLFARNSSRTISVRSAGVLESSRDRSVPWIAAELNFDGRALRLLGLRAPPPISAEMAASRDRSIAAAARWAKEEETPVAVIGDFNATRWSHAIRDFVALTGLCDAERGRGFFPTWPVGSPIQIAIDHTFSSPGLVVLERHLGPDLGSDHRAQEIVFAWRAAD